MANLCFQGFRTIIYLNNILIMHQLRGCLLIQVGEMPKLLEFKINQQKSQEIQFLGLVVGDNGSGNHNDIRVSLGFEVYQCYSMQ